MIERDHLDEYMSQIRNQVCILCIKRRPEAPPCAPHGKRCGIELHLPEIVELTHSISDQTMDPYIERFHDDLCSHCANRTTDQCPCPLETLLQLAVEAIESVDERYRSAVSVE